MHTHGPLISTIVVGLVLAFVLGALANRFRISPLVGYLLAGVLLGPFTPGYVADQKLANDLAEIGVILLMFGVGLHFTLEDLLSVRAIAMPGAIAQIAVATLLGMGLAWLLGWSIGAGLVFGLALSVASTVVLLRALQERRLVETERGRIAVGWLVVEDFVMILTLVLLPALAGVLKGNAGARRMAALVAADRCWTLVKVAAFVAVMLVIGKRVIPWVLHTMAHTGSRELFRLAVLVDRARRRLRRQRALRRVVRARRLLRRHDPERVRAQPARRLTRPLPLRDAFAVLFFVSVGMLVDPMIVVRDPGWLLATLLIIVVGKSLAAFAIVRLFGYPTSHALTISASLAQIGEFSFILAGLGVSLALLPDARSRPDPGRRHPLDPAQPGAVRAASTGTWPGARPPPPRPTCKPPPSRPCASRSGRHAAHRPRRAGRLRPGRTPGRRRPQGAGRCPCC